MTSWEENVVGKNPWVGPAKIHPRIRRYQLALGNHWVWAAFRTPDTPGPFLASPNLRQLMETLRKRTR